MPLFGRDEMNLIEFPFGPITASGQKTFDVDHPVYDRTLKKEVSRKLIITGSDAFGLPRPIDDQVLVGLNVLTHQTSYSSRTIEFTRYRLCKLLGWPTDGRSYIRLEESLDRIAGTTLKFKDSWWDKGEGLWTSQTFHLIDNVSIATRSQSERAKLTSSNAGRQLCSFTWNDVIWKSFRDGFIKRIDMDMFRKIRKGGGKAVPLRLYRILDKRFYNRSVVTIDVRRLCVGTIGLNASYCPRQMLRVLKRASDWLIECGYLSEMRVSTTGRGRELEAQFVKAKPRTAPVTRTKTSNAASKEPAREDKLLVWYRKQPEARRNGMLQNAIAYAKSNEPNLFDGYSRNKGVSPETEKGYTDMIVSKYIEAKIKKKDAVNKAA